MLDVSDISRRVGFRYAHRTLRGRRGIQQYGGSWSPLAYAPAKKRLSATVSKGIGCPRVITPK